MNNLYKIEHSIINFFKLIPDVCDRLCSEGWDHCEEMDLLNKIHFANENGSLNALSDWQTEMFDNEANINEIWGHLFFYIVTIEEKSVQIKTDYYLKLLELKDNNYKLPSFIPIDDSNSVYYNYLDICKYYFEDCLLRWYDDYHKRRDYQTTNEIYPSYRYQQWKTDSELPGYKDFDCQEIIAFSNLETNPNEYIKTKLRELREEKTPDACKSFWMKYYNQSITIEEYLEEQNKSIDTTIEAIKFCCESDDELNERLDIYIENIMENYDNFFDVYKKVVYLDAYLAKQNSPQSKNTVQSEIATFTQAEFRKHFTSPFQNKEYDDIRDDNGLRVPTTRFDRLQSTINGGVSIWKSKDVALLAYKIWRSPFFIKGDYNGSFAGFLRDFYIYCNKSYVNYKPNKLRGFGEFTSQFDYLDE